MILAQVMLSPSWSDEVVLAADQSIIWDLPSFCFNYRHPLFPFTPDRSTTAFTCCLVVDDRLHHLREVGHDQWSHEAEPDSLALRLMSLFPRIPTLRITPQDRRETTCQTGNLHDNLISGYELKQTYLAIPQNSLPAVVSLTGWARPTRSPKGVHYVDFT